MKGLETVKFVGRQFYMSILADLQRRIIYEKSFKRSRELSEILIRESANSMKVSIKNYCIFKEILNDMDTSEIKINLSNNDNNRILRAKEFESACTFFYCAKRHRVICVRENVHLRAIM